MKNILNINAQLELVSDFIKVKKFREAKLICNKIVSNKIPLKLSEQDNLEFDNQFANTYRYLGFIYENENNLLKSIEFYSNSLEIFTKLNDIDKTVFVLSHLGGNYFTISNYKLSLEFYKKALNVYEELGNNIEMARIIGRIGVIYGQINDSKKCIEYLTKALKITQEAGYKPGEAAWLSGLGNIYSLNNDFKQSLEYFQKALKINYKLGDNGNIAGNKSNIGLIYLRQYNLDKALKYFSEALIISKTGDNLIFTSIILRNLSEIYSDPKFPNFDYNIAESQLLEAIKLSKKVGSKFYLSKNYLQLSLIYEKQQKWEQSLKFIKKHILLQNEIKFEEIKKQADIFDHQLKLQEKDKIRAIENSKFLERENILNNILPTDITTRLINKENPIADKFESVSIIFIDIVHFTELSRQVSPDQLIFILNYIFTKFDTIFDEFGLEKIKTIGDAYMAVSGAPIVNNEHVESAANAALKIIDCIKNLKIKIPSKLKDPNWNIKLKDIQVRIGIHCGSAIAGVIGNKKFLYDLWGDSVNTASRMESHGEPGKIHISEEFYNQLIKSEQFNSSSFIYRGELEIKGKGLMKTYFLQ